jgi:hypothetical protein
LSPEGIDFGRSRREESCGHAGTPLAGAAIRRLLCAPRLRGWWADVGIRPYRECRESKYPRRGRCPHRPWSVSKKCMSFRGPKGPHPRVVSLALRAIHLLGISRMALLFRRCVPSIESVGMYNGTTINGIQGDALRLPRRGIAPPRNDMLELPLQERTGQKISDKDD